MKQQPLFITIEGPEGSGKSTLLRQIADWLKSQDIDCLTTREPGGIEIAEQIRDIILDNKNDHMDERTEALLYAAARRQHIIEVINPALLKRKLVICDRFIDSSIVYQGAARGIGEKEIYNMNLFATDGILPDATILLNIDPALGLKRVNERGDKKNRLDNEGLEFHKKVHKAYMILAAKYRDRITTFDASGTCDDTLNEVKVFLKKLLSK